MKRKYVFITIGLFFCVVIVSSVIAAYAVSGNGSPTEKKTAVAAQENSPKTENKVVKKDVPQENKLTQEEKDKKIKLLSAGMKIENDDMQQITFYSYSNKYTNGYYGIYIEPYIGVTADKKAFLRNDMHYSGDGWIFFDRVYIKTDNKTYELNYPKYKAKHEVDDGSVTESYDLLMDDQTLAALRAAAKSQNVKIRFDGKYREDKVLSKVEIEHIKGILELYDVMNQ